MKWVNRVYLLKMLYIQQSILEEGKKKLGEVR